MGNARHILRFVALVLLAIGGQVERAFAVVIEDFGTEPVSPLNYTDWPGLTRLLDHPGRAYRSWGNGDERFCFCGGTASLNEALRVFANVTAETHEVVILPGPGIMPRVTIPRSIAEPVRVHFNWEVNISRLIPVNAANLDRAQNVWSKAPGMTVYVGGDIDLSKLEIPRGVAIVEFSDLRQRYSNAQRSADSSVRASADARLAQLEQFARSTPPAGAPPTTQGAPNTPTTPDKRAAILKAISEFRKA